MSRKDKKNVPVETVGPVAEEIETEAPETAQAVSDETPAQNGDADNGKPKSESITLSAEEFKQVQEHIAKLQKEKDDTVALLQRNQADFDNFRRRNQSVRRDSLEEGRRETVKELLPMLDNFQRAIDAGEDSSDPWADGVKLVFRQFQEALQKLGVIELDASGKFDPNIHNAVAREKTEGKESGDIVEVYQKGYRMGEQIIRHSMVKVAE